MEGYNFYCLRMYDGFFGRLVLLDTCKREAIFYKVRKVTSFK